MSLSQQSPTFSSRLTALAQRLGLIGRAQRQILERASQLRLPFSPLPAPRDSICWLEDPQLHRLVDLPRDALSGPVQEDKAHARGMLMRIVEQKQHALASQDLRLIDGLGSCDPEQTPFTNFEQYAASEACRQVRIISYKDFIKTVSLALPGFLASEKISLRQASWHGPRLYWAGEQHNDAFACAVVYARRRGLDTTLPAELTHYRISLDGLAQLQQHYHVQAMPAEAWSDPTFMGLLLDNGLPYSRLSLLRGAGSAEFLLLPKHSAEARALGEGLRLAGAPDVVSYLKQLADTDASETP